MNLYINLNLDIEDKYYDYLYCKCIYAKIFNTIKFTKEWYNFLTLFLSKINDNDMIQWWDEIVDNTERYNVVKFISSTTQFNRFKEITKIEGLDNASDMASIGF